MATTLHRSLILGLPLVFVLAACGTRSGDSETSPATAAPAAERPAAPPPEHAPRSDRALAPLPGKENAAPALTRATTALMETTAGDVTIEIYPEAAPNAARRFIELVQAGFYDDTPVSRVVPGFVAQFGINWRAPQRSWKDRTFNDDPSLFALERGTLAFAKAGPNTNSTQVFINYVENNQLAAPEYNFTVFGQVVDGMDVVDAFVQVGDRNGGLDQGRLWSDGGTYLDALAVKPTMIERIVLQ